LNLCIDIGNTTTRLYIYDGRKPVSKMVFKKLDVKALKGVFNKHIISASILSSVVDEDKKIAALLRKETDFIKLSHKTALPIENKYATPKTLGMDRLACAVAGAYLYLGKHVLIIDAGTCIKYDFVSNENKYLGGSISPGLQMRLDAMHKFTGKLPQLKAEKWVIETGNDTKTSMLSGVFFGALYEMNGFIKHYSELYKQLQVILTGGDAHHFAVELNFPIFAEPDLTGIGLNEILLHNQTRN
jgi:type III pantothenate kinase